MEIIYDNSFDNVNGSYIFQIIPNKFNDDRGYFTEVLKSSSADKNMSVPLWLNDQNWIKQINRSCSSGGTIRGCHAQKSPFCQGKLVEALNTKIYDIITDARPDSNSFGVTKVYVLDPEIQNKLWVANGFLHSFVVPKASDNALFQYYCNNVYDKSSEICINPLSLLPNVIALYKKFNNETFSDLYEVFDNDPVISDKDKIGLNYETWMEKIRSEYSSNKILWYK